MSECESPGRELVSNISKIDLAESSQDHEAQIMSDQEPGVALELEIGEPPQEVLEYARKNIRETPEIREQALKDLRALIENDEELVTPTDDRHLLRFLRPRRFYPDRAYTLIKKYYEFKENNIELYRGVNPYDLLFIGDDGVFSVPPYRDQEGRRIMIYRVGRWDPSRYSVDELFKAAIIIMELGTAEPETQIRGGVGIFDLAGMSFTHVWNITPSIAKKVVDLLTHCFPMRFREFHIINQPFVFEMIYALFKPFLDERMRERIYFHGSSIESLHKHMDPKFLPEMYGGTRPEYHYSLWVEGLENNEELMEEALKMGYVVDKNNAQESP